MRAMTFAGTLHDDGRFELEPGFIVEGKPAPNEGDLEVVVLAGDDKPVATSRLVLETLCGIPRQTDDHIALRSAFGLIAFPEGASGLRVVHRRKILLTLRGPRTSAKFTAEWPEPESTLAERQHVRWRASVEGCRAALGYSHDDGRTWIPVSLPSVQGEILAALTGLPGGEKCLFELIATDGFTTTRLRSPPFKVAQKGWVLWILVPAADAVIDSDVVSLAAQAYQLEKRRPGFDAIEWTSSIDGRLCSGARLVTTLSPGTHRITAERHNVASEVIITVKSGD